MELLKKRIKDKKFLKTIHRLLKAGIMDTLKDTLIYDVRSNVGVPHVAQARSPILWNIYFQEFDKYIANQLEIQIQKWNVTENRSSKARTSISYKKLDHKLNKAKKTSLKLYSEINTPYNDAKQPTHQQLDHILKNRKEIRGLRIKKFKVPSKNYFKNILRIHYVRYADDWVIFTNCSLERCEEIKKQLTIFLDKTLNLTLDPVKTKITNLNKDYVNFLAFSIGIRKFPLVKRNSLGYLRRVGHNIIIRPDRNRIISRLIMKLMAKTKLSNNTIIGIGVPFYTHFEINDIINKFNAISRGVYNYYLPIVKPAYLTEFGYLVNYSCYRTICRKYKMSIRKLAKSCSASLTPLTVNVEMGGTTKPYTVLTHTQLIREFRHCERDTLLATG
jgi:hypothetical protein